MILRLQKPLEKAIRAGHPWIFRDALLPFDAPPGSVITVHDRADNFLCRGLAEEGPIGVRVFTITDIPLDAALIKIRIQKALVYRDKIRSAETTCLRLINGEGDRIPGLILDQYGPFAVLVLDGSSLDIWQETIYSVLRQELGSRWIKTLLLRTRYRHEKSIETLWGEKPDQELIVTENGMRLFADLLNGQKTGLFLDHRDSRLAVRQVSKNKRVLNLYGYTGGFSAAAGLGGAAEVTTVDIAPGAITLADKTWRENNLDPEKHHGIVSDVPEYINAIKPGSFDLVIADPPSFAPKKSATPNALKAYRLLHASIFRAIKSGTYIAASCSSHVTKEMFEATLLDAAQFCHKTIRIKDIWGAGKDHPVLKNFPEGDYLKVFSVLVQ